MKLKVTIEFDSEGAVVTRTVDGKVVEVKKFSSIPKRLMFFRRLFA